MTASAVFMTLMRMDAL